MRHFLLTISPLALLLALSSPAFADRHDHQFDRDGTREHSRDRGDNDKRGGSDKSADHSSDRHERKDADNSRDSDKSRDRGGDVTGSTHDHDGDGDRDHDHHHGGGDNDHHGHHDHDGGGHHGGWDRDHRGSREHVRSGNYHDPSDRILVVVNPNAAEIASLQDLIDENEAEIARAYRQASLTRDRQMRSYLRQQIASLTRQNQKLQARIDALD